MRRLAAAAVVLLALAGCARTARPTVARVIAVETFLADIAREVAGDRIAVQALLPIGVDPHAFEPAPRDVAAIADASLLIVNGAGFEAFLSRLLEGLGGTGKGPRIVEAAAGLVPRLPREGEPSGGHESDPHFWLDPLSAIRYVENIRDALGDFDPSGAPVYERNAAAYVAKLRDLDRWIAAEVATVPPGDRLLVTNHESLGYFADRYGFRVVGTVIPSVSTGSTPGAKQLAALVERIRATGARAVFLETGADSRLAAQVAGEVGARLVTDLYTHSVTEPGGPAPTYLQMMRADTRAIVGALRAP